MRVRARSVQQQLCSTASVPAFARHSTSKARQESPLCMAASTSLHACNHPQIQILKPTAAPHLQLDLKVLQEGGELDALAVAAELHGCVGRHEIVHIHHAIAGAWRRVEARDPVEERRVGQQAVEGRSGLDGRGQQTLSNVQPHTMALTACIAGAGHSLAAPQALDALLQLRHRHAANLGDLMMEWKGVT